MLKESGTWLCWPIIMRDKNPVAGCFYIRIKIGVFKDYCEKNLLNSYCISEILTIFSKIPDQCPKSVVLSLRREDPEQYIKNSDPNLYKPYNTFSLQMYKVIVKFWLQIYRSQDLVIGF